MEFNNNKLIALIGTIVFHAAVFLLLFFTFIATTVPEEDTGVLVNFGYVELSAGFDEPKGNQSVAIQSASSAGATANPESKILTQDIEESVAIPNPSKADNERRLREEAARIESEKLAAEQRKQQEAQRQLEQDIAKRVAGAMGIGDANTENQGSGTIPAGNEGSPFGNSNTGPNTGVGGFGGSFNLTGRVIRGGGLAQPAGSFDESGKIVLDIVVDRNGNVIQADIARGTDINSLSMRSNAIDAAKRTKFSSIAGTNNQNGTITYRYLIK